MNKRLICNDRTIYTITQYKFSIYSKYINFHSTKIALQAFRPTQFLTNSAVVEAARCSVSFLPRDAMLARCLLWPSVCLSVRSCVCLSQVGVLSKYHNANDAAWHPRESSFYAKLLHEIPLGSLPVGCEINAGIKQLRVSTNNWLYIENATRQT